MGQWTSQALKPLLKATPAPTADQPVTASVLWGQLLSTAQEEKEVRHINTLLCSHSQHQSSADALGSEVTELHPELLLLGPHVQGKCKLGVSWAVGH